MEKITERKSMLVIKRNWNNAEIKIETDKDGIRIEAPVKDFLERFKAVLGGYLGQVNIIMRTQNKIGILAEEAWKQVIKEMKEETRKIV